MSAPPANTDARRYWEMGATDEARARDEVLTAGHKEVRDVVELLAQARPEWSQARLLAAVLGIFVAGLSRREKLRLFRSIW